MQPPSGGCVLKLDLTHLTQTLLLQPPSGGCVLKQGFVRFLYSVKIAATFGWLCVETNQKCER